MTALVFTVNNLDRIASKGNIAIFLKRNGRVVENYFVNAECVNKLEKIIKDSYYGYLTATDLITFACSELEEQGKEIVDIVVSDHIITIKFR